MKNRAYSCLFWSYRAFDHNPLRFEEKCVLLVSKETVVLRRLVRTLQAHLLRQQQEQTKQRESFSELTLNNCRQMSLRNNVLSYPSD